MDNQELKEQILSIIMDATPSITADQIFDLFTECIDPGRTQETIRQMIRELVNDDSNLVGSYSNGYFYIKSEPDFKKAIKHLTSRIEKLQNRAGNLRTLWSERNNTEANG